MRAFNTFLSCTFFGALVGALISSWLAPKGIAWYFDPPVDMGINCKSATEWSMSRLLIFQAIGTAFGVISGMLIFFMFKGRGSKILPPPPPTQN